MYCQSQLVAYGHGLVTSPTRIKQYNTVTIVNTKMNYFGPDNAALHYFRYTIESPTPNLLQFQSLVVLLHKQLGIR